MNDLMTDLNITPDTNDFFSVSDIQKAREKMLVHPSDHQFSYFMNTLFSPLDMTDYEDSFVSFNEIAGGLPINNYTLLKPLQEEPWPMNH
jgi:hypothetical protein